MKKSLRLAIIGVLALTAGISLANNSYTVGIKEDTKDAYENIGVSLRKANIGASETVDVSRTFVQYGSEGTRNFVRFATAVSGPVKSIKYVRTVAGLDTKEKEVTTVYKGIQAAGGVYYYNGSEVVTTASELTDNYYWACYTIEFTSDTYKAADITAHIVVETEASDEVIESTPRTESFNDLKAEADKTLYIHTVEELKAFRDAVNAGNTYAGKVVKLVNNIDLNNENWTPIGLTGDSAGFQGTFDGNNKTIFNLKVEQTTPASQSAGLFGSARNGVIKNFTIENAYISSTTTGSATSCGTAVVVGSAQFPLTIDNVDVKNAEVYSNRYAAVICGYFNGTITNCDVTNVKVVATPDNYTGSYDNGDKVGGIVGYINGSTSNISNNTIDSFEIKAYRDLGGIVGAGHASNLMNNKATNGSVTSDQTLNNYGAKTPNNNPILGRNLGSTVLDASNISENVVTEAK